MIFNLLMPWCIHNPLPGVPYYGQTLRGNDVFAKKLTILSPQEKAAFLVPLKWRFAKDISKFTGKKPQWSNFALIEFSLLVSLKL